jgi:hypothetical protein
MPDNTQTVDIDSTIAALQGDLTAISPEAAVSTIEAWQQQLQGTEIGETLGQLKLALTGGSVGAAAVSDLLADLGSQTLMAANAASGDVAAKLQRLGQLLSQAGGSAP